MKKLLVFLGSTICILLFSQSVSAVGITPAKFVFDAEPGELIETEFKVLNGSNSAKNFAIIAGSYTYNQDGQRIFLTEEEQIPSFSVQPWIDLSSSTLKVGPNDEEPVQVKFQIPKNATPGTYVGAIFISSAPDPSSDGNTGVTIAGRVALVTHITISGATNSELAVENFYVDQVKLKNGKLSFISSIKGTGDGGAIPVGNIKIYDTKGNQIIGIIRETKEINGENVVIGFKDDLAFNLSGSPVLPGIVKEYQTEATGLALKKGEYVAKLSAFYGFGENQQTLEAEAAFELTEDISIDTFSTDNFHFSPPVLFQGSLSNNGTKKIVGDMQITIRNLFGAKKEIIDLNQVGIESGESFSLNQNAVWEEVFAMGFYTAELSFAFNEGNNIVSETISFWIISWLQLGIILILSIALIFIIVKLIQTYNKMKRKVAELDKKK